MNGRSYAALPKMVGKVFSGNFTWKDNAEVDVASLREVVATRLHTA